MNEKEEHPCLLYLIQIFDNRAKCGLQTKIDPQDESRWTWPLFGQFRGCYWCDPAWIQRHFSYCHMWFSTFAQENHVNDAKNCHAAFASKKKFSFNFIFSNMDFIISHLEKIKLWPVQSVQMVRVSFFRSDFLQNPYFNRLKKANQRNFVHTVWTVNDILVDPYNFYCIKRVWIDQNKK